MQAQLATCGHGVGQSTSQPACSRRTSTLAAARHTKQPFQHSRRLAGTAHRHRVARATNGAVGDNSSQVSLQEEDQDDDNEMDLEAKMEDFLRQQALAESGQAYVAPEAATSGRVLGAEDVTEQDAREYCTLIRDRIKLLKSNRDMGFNEIKLTIAIEDPRARERRENLGIEDESGVSRDELAAALQEVAEGRIPKDRLALRELAAEMLEWPYADLSNDSRLQQRSAEPAPEEEKGILRPKKLLGRDKNEKPEGIADLLPDWVGYGALYAVSSAPVIIGVVVITVLFLNSLK